MKSAPRWIRVLIVAGCLMFILALIVSAVFDPTIRVLHTLQIIPYAAVIVLTRRDNAIGYGIGCLLAAFWNYLNLFVTTFIAAGMHQLGILLRTGHLPRPDLLIAVDAALGHFLMIAGCLAGFLCMRPRRWPQFVAAGILSIGYLVAIIFLAGRQYIPLMHRVFHL